MASSSSSAPSTPSTLAAGSAASELPVPSRASASAHGALPGARRLLALDVVRGIAVCGILFTNISALLWIWTVAEDGGIPGVTIAEHLLFKERFFPIFSFLFGIGFGMIWDSARRRARYPRVILLRRLLALALFAAVHVLLHPGEALSVYAIIGLLVLMPATLVPARHRRWVCAALGAVLLVPGVWLGGQLLVPSLFLLGFAVAGSSLVTAFESSARPGLVLAAIGAVVAAPALVLQLRDPAMAGFSAASSIAGFGTAMVIVGGTGAALHTSLRAPLAWFFAPLGRMALTTYVSATLVATLARLILLPQVGGTVFITLADAGPVDVSPSQLLLAWAGCAALLVVQSLLSRWWLHRFGQGPLERLWRAMTWAGARPAAVSPQVTPSQGTAA